MQQVYLEYLGDSIELPVGETVIGRDVGCALRFNDSAISRRHLRFIRRQDEVFVEDLGSSNGTLLNGLLVGAPLRVQDGDTIRVGSRQITVRVNEGETEEEASTVLLRKLETVAPRSHNTMRAVTAQIAAVVPPPRSVHQRCPRCAAPVTELDDECEKCNYQWGSFRPMSVTAVRPSPISRRRHDRCPIELSLVYVSSELEIEAVTLDLSKSGVFVCTQVLDPVGTACQLTILIDGGPPLRIGGIVRRVVEHDRVAGEPNGLGVEFIGVGDNELAWIETAAARLEDDGDASPPS